MKNLIREIYRKRYGVVGSLKPPLGYPPTRITGVKIPLRKRLVYKCKWAVWCVENRIYNWTGLPQEWRREVYGEK